MCLVEPMDTHCSWHDEMSLTWTSSNFYSYPCFSALIIPAECVRNAQKCPSWIFQIIPLGYIHLVWTFHSNGISKCKHSNWNQIFKKSPQITWNNEGAKYFQEKILEQGEKIHALCEIFHVLRLYLLHCFNEWNGRELICFKLLRVSEMVFFSVHKCNERHTHFPAESSIQSSCLDLTDWMCYTLLLTKRHSSRNKLTSK